MRDARWWGLRLARLLSLVFLMLAGCGGSNGTAVGGMSRLLVHVTTTDQSSPSLTQRAVSSTQTRQVGRSITRLRVEVSGVDISTPVVVECPIPGPSTANCQVTETLNEFIVEIELAVPRGFGRVISVTAFDSAGTQILRGTQTVDVTQAVQTVSVTLVPVNPVNVPPVATDDTFITAEDTPLIVGAPGVLGNDNDVDLDSLTAVLVQGPVHGQVVLRADGSLTYTPAPNFNGTDRFTYQAHDGTADSNVAAVTITITAVNDVPVAQNDVYSTPEDTSLTVLAPGVLANDNDVEDGGTALTAVLVTLPAHGTLALQADGAFVYTPTLHFNGTDSFTYQAKDTMGALSNLATGMITVLPVNDAPVAMNDRYTTAEDTALVVPAPGVLANDSDSDSPTLTVRVGVSPLFGTLVLQHDGAFVYTPTLNFNGNDSFTYKVNDGSLDSNVAMVTITINAVNDPPVAASQVVTTAEDTAKGITLSASDVDSASLAFSLGSGPSHGTLSALGAPACVAAGAGSTCTASVTYTPTANYNGPDNFTFTVSDGSLTSAAATVTLTVTAVNDMPVVTPATFSVPENSANGVVVGTVAFTDPDAGQSHTFAITAGNTGGAFAINASTGQLTVANSAAVDFEVTSSFSLTVRVIDNGTPALSGSATITVNLTNVNEAPVVNAATFSVPENSANGTVVGTGTFTDPDAGQSHTFVITAGNTGGAFAINASTGQLTVANSAAVDFETTPTFSLTVQVTDNGTPPLFGSATITVNLTNVNEAPVVNAATFSIPENSANGTLVGTPVTFSDPDAGQSHTFAITAGNTRGAFAINASTGQITVANSEALNFETTPSFSLTVRVTDNGTPPLFGSATITINLTPIFFE